MAFSVLEKPQTRSEGQYDGKEGQDDSTREWDVASDTPTDAEHVRAFAPSIARIGDVHPFNPAKTCRSVDVRHHSGSTLVFDVIARYSVPTSQGGKSQKPTDQPPKISYDYAITEESIDCDADGKPIMTKTGEAFDPPIRRPFGDLVVTVTRNVDLATFDKLLVGNYLFTTNSDSWLGLPPGTALITKVQGEQIIDQSGSYVTKTTSVQYRQPRGKTDPSKAWYWRQLAAGFQWRLTAGMQTAFLKHSSGTENFFTCFMSDGRDAVKPQLHDPQTGYPYSFGGLIDYSPERANPNGFYYFKIYPSKSFSNAQIF